MRIAALILGLLGALASFGLGAKWVSDLSQNKDLITQLEQRSESLGGVADPQLAELKKLSRSAYSLVALGIMGLIGAFVTLKSPKLGGAIMLISGIIPGIFASKAFVVTFLLILAGILGLLAKPKASAVTMA